MNQQLSEIKEALSKTTPGPWNSLPDAVRKGHGPGGWICQMYDGQEEEIVEFENQVENAILIANAPQWLASLVSEVERLQEIDERESLVAISVRNENRLLKAKVEEMQKTLGILNDYVFANLEIPKSARSHMQRIIHYDLPVALQSLKETNPGA